MRRGLPLGYIVEIEDVMRTTAFATVDTMHAAIAANVRVSLAEMQRAIGSVVVTTSDRLEENQVVALDAMAALDPESQTTVFLADRIPAGQESWAFLRNTVLKCLRHEQPKDWELLVDRLRNWRNDRGENAFSPVPLPNMVYSEAAARVAYLRLSDSDAQEALVAFAVEAAAKRCVVPSADAPYGSVEAWLGELISDLRGVSERLLGSDLPDFESKVMPGIAQSLGAPVVQAKVAPAPIRTTDRVALYQAAKLQVDQLWAASKATGSALDAFLEKHGRGPMGLTPDAVKAMPEYRKLKSESDAAMRALQAFNKGFVRDFAKERAADRSARYATQMSEPLPAMAVKEVPVARTKEQILEQRVAVLMRQVSEARSALESVVSPMSSGEGWLSSPYYKDDVTEHVGDVLTGPATMCDALWEIKALAELSLQQDRSGICSAYEVMELATAGLASADGSAHEEEMLSTLQRAAQVNIERGDSMIARELASVVDRCLFAGAEMVNVADKTEDAAPGL